MVQIEKTHIESVDREIYDVKNKFEYDYKTKAGLTPEIIREISAQKNEPEWMLDFRLKSLDIYNKLEVPTWGADISELNIDNIVKYIA